MKSPQENQKPLLLALLLLLLILSVYGIRKISDLSSSARSPAATGEVYSSAEPGERAPSPSPSPSALPSIEPLQGAPFLPARPTVTHAPTETDLELYDAEAKEAFERAFPEKAPEPEWKGPTTALRLAPEFSFVKLDGYDLANATRASLVSDLSYGLDVSFWQIWDRRWRSFLKIGMQQIAFKEASTRRIENSSSLYSQVEAGVERQLDSRWTVGASIGARQEPFFRGRSTNSVTLDKIFIPTASLLGRYEFLSTPAFIWGTELKGTLSFPVTGPTYDTKLGKGMKGFLYFRQAENAASYKPHLGGGLFYERLYQDTSIAEQTRSDFGLSLGVQWNFGLKP